MSTINDRRRWLSFTLFVLLTFLSLPQLYAQGSGSNTDPEMARKEGRIRYLLEVMHQEEYAHTVVETVIGSIRDLTSDVPDSYWKEFVNEFDPGELIELVIPIYARHFTMEEIEHMIAFYESETGQSIVSKLPGVTQESMIAGRQWGIEIGQRIARKLMNDGYEIEQI